jgi:dTDP-glucose 4,6-dehydratase
VVTGGAGFLGSHLCEQLLLDGYEVVCVDNLVTGCRENIEHLLDSVGFRLVEADLSSVLELDGTVDLIFHFASPASPPDYLRLPIETLKVGSLGTLNALELAKVKGARFVLASTSEVYGDPLVHPQPETYWGHVNPIGPRGVYDEAKRFGEAAAVAYRKAFGVNTAIIRIFNTYGERMRPDDGRAIPTFISQALRGEPLTVTGDGTQTRSICYVDDLIAGILAMANSDESGPINLGNPTEMDIHGIAEMIKELAQSNSSIQFVPRMVDDPSVRCPDITLARERLQWSPKVDPRDGLLQTIDWFRLNMSCHQ